MKRLAMFCVVSTVFIAYLNADELPMNIRRSSEEVLGTIDPLEVDACIVRRFADPYPSLSGSQNREEYRWRVRVPMAQRSMFFGLMGELPEEGFPRNGRRMIPTNRHYHHPQATLLLLFVRATTRVSNSKSVSSLSFL